MIVRLRALSAPGRVVSAGGFTASVSSAVSPFLSSPLLQDITPTALSDTASSAAVGSGQQRSHTCMQVVTSREHVHVTVRLHTRV